MSYTANTASLLPNAGPQAYLQYASPVATGASTGTIMITFPAISQGLQALVSVNIPDGTSYQTFSVYLNGSLVGSMVGNNPFGPLNLNGGDIVSISGPTVTGNGVMTGSIGPTGSISLSPVVASGGTSGSIALASFVSVSQPSAGTNWAYTIPEPTPLRLVAFTGILTTSSTAAWRNPYLWQVLASEPGNPAEETLLSQVPQTASASVTYDASPGAGPTLREYNTRLASGTLGSGSFATLFAVGQGSYAYNIQLFVYNTAASSISVYAGTNATVDAYVSLAANGSAGSSAVIDLPPCDPGDTIQAEASATSDVTYVLSATLNQDNRRISSFSGILMPPGSQIVGVTGNIQSGDQWSNIRLAFVQS